MALMQTRMNVHPRAPGPHLKKECPHTPSVCNPLGAIAVSTLNDCCADLDALGRKFLSFFGLHMMRWNDLAFFDYLLVCTSARTSRCEVTTLPITEHLDFLLSMIACGRLVQAILLRRLRRRAHWYRALMSSRVRRSFVFNFLNVMPFFRKAARAVFLQQKFRSSPAHLPT